MSWPGIDHWAGGPHEHELEPMSWEELGRLAAAGWEVGSHTRSHPLLTQVADDDSLAGELAQSKAVIESRLDRPCESIAYPYGDHDDRVVERLAGRATGRPEPCPHASWAKARCAAPAWGSTSTTTRGASA